MKKSAQALQETEELLYSKGQELGKSQKFLDYLWHVQIEMSKSYAFASSHSHEYSTECLQELNLYWKYPKVYWNTAVVITQSQTEDERGGSATINYGKISQSIYKAKESNINITPPYINNSNISFEPNEENDTIIFGLGAISGINPQIAQQIIDNRPYKSFDDFYKKNVFTGSLVTQSKIIQLIKAGCFDEFSSDRIKIMKRYFILSNPKPTQLTLANINNIKSTIKLPKEIFGSYNFYKYVTSKEFFYENHPKFKSKKLYWLDNKAMKYFNDHCINLGQFGVDFWEENDKMIVVDKWLEKIFKNDFDNIKNYINTTDFLTQYYKSMLRKKFNDTLPNQDPNHWSMEAVSYYTNTHELANINYIQYNLTSFQDIPSEPIFIERTTKGRNWKQFELYRICGTVIDRNDNHHLISILTPENNVVSVKFESGFYAYLKKQDSEVINGQKIVLEKSWLNRGNLLMLTGYRRGESDFVIKSYKSAVLNNKVSKINNIYEDGTVELQTERLYAEN